MQRDTYTGNDLSQISEKKLYNVINCLTDHTKEMIREHRTSEVAQCFRQPMNSCMKAPLWSNWQWSVSISIQ